MRNVSPERFLFENRRFLQVKSRRKHLTYSCILREIRQWKQTTHEAKPTLAIAEYNICIFEHYVGICLENLTS